MFDLFNFFKKDTTDRINRDYLYYKDKYKEKYRLMHKLNSSNKKANLYIGISSDILWSYSIDWYCRVTKTWVESRLIAEDEIEAKKEFILHCKRSEPVIKEEVCYK